MRKLMGMAFLLLVACQTSNDFSITPVSQAVVDNQVVMDPTLTATAVPTITPTATQTPLPTVTPTETPSPMPSLTPLPHPFELDIVGELVAYPLPIFRQGDTAVYIQASRLTVANVADPASPMVIWQKEFSSNVIDAKVDKNNLYIWLNDEVQIWSITDWQEPAHAASLPFDIDEERFRKEITVDTNTLYLLQAVRDDALLTAIDVSLPESPKILGTSEFYLRASHQFLVSGGSMFVVDDEKIDIYDISDPSRPQLLSQINAPTNINSSISLQDDRLFVATLPKLILLALDSMPIPTQVSEYADWQINQMAISDRTAFLYAELCGWEPKDDGSVSGGCGYMIDVIDILDPAKPESKGFIRLRLSGNQSFAEKMVLRDNYLYFEFSDGNVYMVAINQFGE